MTAQDLALSITEALVAGAFDAAHDMLCPSIRDQWPASLLRSEYESMIAYAGETTVDEVGLVEETIVKKWTGQQPGELAWIYVSISGKFQEQEGIWNEGVDVLVVENEGRLMIRDIIWGRP